jgi:hypothetical protein
VAVSGDFRWPRLGILNGRFRGVSGAHFGCRGPSHTLTATLVLP